MRDFVLGLSDMPSPHALHTLVYERLLAPGQPRRFLYAPAHVQGRPAALVRGDFSGTVYADHGRLLEPPTAGSEHAFFLRANPTVTLNGKTSQIALRAEKDSLRRRWLERRATERGFEVLDLDDLATAPCVIDKPGRPFRLNVTSYTGRLRVVDATLFETALRSGIGRAAAWGCGLLILQPADRGLGGAGHSLSP